MSTARDILKRLETVARPDQLDGMARYGMTREGRLGVSIPELRKLAKSIGKDHGLALKLWKTGIQEARILAAMIDRPEEVTEAQMEEWVSDFNSWDVCDQVCMNLFDKVPPVRRKIREWALREEEFVKRAAFALIACLAWHDKQAPDRDFIAFLPLIRQGASDERNFVKKSVNWALRHIGKRNAALNQAAIETAREIRQMDSRAARWVAGGAIRELTGEAVQQRLKRSRSGARDPNG